MLKYHLMTVPIFILPSCSSQPGASRDLHPLSWACVGVMVPLSEAQKRSPELLPFPQRPHLGQLSVIPESPAFLIEQKAACFDNKFWNLILTSDIHGWACLPLTREVPQITRRHCSWIKAQRGGQAVRQNLGLHDTKHGMLSGFTGSCLLSEALKQPKEIL